MKVCVLLTNVEMRKSVWNGGIMRYGGVGVSGTELTLIVAAEQLAKHGHDVVFYNNVFVPSVINGVRYVRDMQSIVDSEVVITIPWVQIDMMFPKMHTLIINFPCQEMTEKGVNFIQRHSQMLKKVIAVHPSVWTLNYLKNDRYYHFCQFETVIPNPIMMDVIKRVDYYNVPKKFHSAIFPAVWERGGDVALRIYEKLRSTLWSNEKTCFTVMDYNKNAPIPRGREDIVSLGECDKETVLLHMAMTEYFFYPLVLPDGRVHKDTFACCVAEALAMGAIVLTWPVAALPELYRDMVVFVDLPQRHNPMLHENRHCIDFSLSTEESVDAYVQKVIEIENNPTMKKELQVRGKTKARELYADHVIGQHWASAVKF